MRQYLFTNKFYSAKSVMSVVLGCAALFFLVLACIHSFRVRGNVDAGAGLTAFLAMVYAIIGLFLAIWSRLERDRFYLFAYIGMGVNGLSLALTSAILYAGALLS